MRQRLNRLPVHRLIFFFFLSKLFQVIPQCPVQQEETDFTVRSSPVCVAKPSCASPANKTQVHSFGLFSAFSFFFSNLLLICGKFVCPI